jgi:signal transduction histidine kinase
MQSRWLRFAGVIVWLMVAVPIGVQARAIPLPLLASWAAVYALFLGLFFVDNTWSLALQAACVLVVVAILCNGFEGTLMVLIAMRLGSSVNLRGGLTWIAIQSLLLAVAIAFHWNGHSALLLTPPYFGFQILAFFTFRVLDREARAAERLRIARELHDSLGHHLTALALNLESALVRTEGEANCDVQKAQALARSLLADIRGIVAAETTEIDLAEALRDLATHVPQPRVHLQMDRLNGVRSAHVIFRCAQEIITNAARHSGAQNLWISIERSGGGVQLRARDDGTGTAAADGFGIRGMRARVEAAGGELTITAQPGRGFVVVASLP